MNNFLVQSKSPRDRSPIHIRKVSPMFRRNVPAKPSLNLGGLGFDQSDDELTNSEKKQLNGENPFDGSTVSGQEKNHQENMRNLFFHQRGSAQPGEERRSTGDFGK